MIEAAGTFDAWGSALVGAAAAVGAVLVAQYFVSRTRRDDLERAAKLREQDLRLAEDLRTQDRKDSLSRDRRRLADELIIAISNLRDAAVYSGANRDGSFSLFPVRNALYTARWALDGLPSYHNAYEFYHAVAHLRKWLRARRAEDEHRPRDGAALDLFCEGIESYGSRVIEELQLFLEAETLPKKSWRKEGLPDLPQ